MLLNDSYKHLDAKHKTKSICARTFIYHFNTKIIKIATFVAQINHQMEYFDNLFVYHSAVQSVVVLSLICAVGLALGKVRVAGVSLRVACVFFTGIIAGHLGLQIDGQILAYAETFGLVLFVYALGLSVGPNFFSGLRSEGLQLNLWSMAVIVLGTVMGIAYWSVGLLPLGDMVGVLCGATTNTPALGAAQQALAHLGMPTGSAALATAVTYPLGVVGVILAMVIIRKLFVTNDDLRLRHPEDSDHTHVDQYVVRNPALEGKNIGDISHTSHLKFVISRIWRGSDVIVPLSSSVLHIGDNILCVANRDEVEAMTMLFGEHVERDWNTDKIDWNHIDNTIESRTIVVSKTKLNGKRLGQLQLRHAYGVNVSRVSRGDIKLLASDNLQLQYGDRLAVVGTPEQLDHVEAYLGNAASNLNEPNLGAIFLGMLLGVAIGTIPISLPGMQSPIRLGIAGGPIVMGIIVGSLGPRIHFISYTTRSASLMLRRLGLSLYLACLGLDAGGELFETLMRPEGLIWIALGASITVLPVLVVGLTALRTRRYDFGTICGILCGSMANPMALGYANDTTEGETANISYAAVYPLGMFVRVIIAQLLIMYLLAA